MKLVDVYKRKPAVKVLWRLLNERPRSTWISTKAIPDFKQHEKFVKSKPYFAWYLLEVEGKGFVGSIYHGHDNSVGVSIFKEYQRQGYGAKAVRLLLEEHRPLPAQLSRRNGNFIANIAPGNKDSISFFEGLGFRHIQNTYACW